MSLWKKLKRTGQHAYTFQFSATIQEVKLTCNKKFTPGSLSVSWSRRGRRQVSTKPSPYQPSIADPYEGSAVWDVPENLPASITLFRDPSRETFEPKEWSFLLEHVLPNNHTKQLASRAIDLAEFASAEVQGLRSEEITLKMLSQKLTCAKITCTISWTLIKSGIATEEDLQSWDSMESFDPPAFSTPSSQDNNNPFARGAKGRMTTGPEHMKAFNKGKGSKLLSSMRRKPHPSSTSLNQTPEVVASPSMISRGSIPPEIHAQMKARADALASASQIQRPDFAETPPDTPTPPRASSLDDLTDLRDEFAMARASNTKKFFGDSEVSRPIFTEPEIFPLVLDAVVEEAVVDTKNMDLLSWCQHITTGYKGVEVVDMTTSWRDGLAFCALIHHHRPELIEYNKLKAKNASENLEMAFEMALTLGVQRIVEVEEMLSSIDRLAILTYVYQLRNKLTNRVEEKDIISHSEVEEVKRDMKLAAGGGDPPANAEIPVVVPEKVLPPDSNLMTRKEFMNPFDDSDEDEAAFFPEALPQPRIEAPADVPPPKKSPEKKQIKLIVNGNQQDTIAVRLNPVAEDSKTEVLDFVEPDGAKQKALNWLDKQKIAVSNLQKAAVSNLIPKSSSFEQTASERTETAARVKDLLGRRPPISSAQQDPLDVQMRIVEQELKQVDMSAVSLERQLRYVMENGDTAQEQKLLPRWYALVNKRNGVVRRQVHLRMLERQQELELQYKHLEKEIRETERRGGGDELPEMMQRLVSVVNHRDELVAELQNHEAETKDDEEIGRQAEAASVGMKQNPDNCAVM